MIERAVDSMFFPMTDGSIEFYPLGVCSRGLVIRSTHDAAEIRARVVRFYRSALSSFLLLCAAPHVVVVLLVGLSQLPTPGTILVVGGVWFAVISIAGIATIFLWCRQLRQWKGELEQTTNRLTLTMAADNAAARFSKAQLLTMGGAMGLGAVVVGDGLVEALRIESSLGAVLKYLQLWILVLGITWVGYVVYRAREQRENRLARNSG